MHKQQQQQRKKRRVEFYLQKKEPNVHVEKTNPILNSLQCLSVSYGGDTDSPSSSAAPSPKSLPPDEENVDILHHVKDSVDKENIVNVPEKPIKLSLALHKDSPSQKMSPIRLKLNSSKFRVWSPITKGVLHPKININRSMPDPSELNKLKEKVDNNVEQNVNKPEWSEEKLNGNGRMFGPMMPPPAMVKRKRNDSINSEVCYGVMSKFRPNSIREKSLHMLPLNKPFFFRGEFGRNLDMVPYHFSCKS